MPLSNIPAMHPLDLFQSIARPTDLSSRAVIAAQAAASQNIPDVYIDHAA
jgi:hypothetical protein